MDSLYYVYRAIVFQILWLNSQKKMWCLAVTLGFVLFQ